MLEQTENHLVIIEIADPQELTDAERAEARRLKAEQAIMPTPEEDAEITAAALKDPDNPTLADGAMNNFKPARLPHARSM